MSWPPPAFAVEDSVELDALLANIGLGTMVSQGPDGFLITHMPFVYDAASKTLRGHISRANPHAELPDATPALVTFHRLDAYIPPALYPGKAVHGKVAPTWNYEFLNVQGPLHWRPDAEWLRAILGALTDKNEAGRAEPWKVEDAPADYTANLITMIVGVEIPIERIDGRRKLSQNRRHEDRSSIIAGMTASPDANDQRMAAAMQALEDR